ncbi:MAG: molybdenum cofactor guanylyltransferase [Porticoccaceae bacterium]|nr:molybdenum cofactor guanylyltransferase [Porticoccaceae bacterium]
MTAIDGLILAAGRSSRMGSGNKGQALLAGRPLLEHVSERLAPQVDNLFINGLQDDDLAWSLPLVKGRVKDSGEAFQGPLSGLWSALTDSRLQSTYLMIVPCDGPFIPDNLVAELYAQIITGNADVVCIRYKGIQQPTFSLWHKRVTSAVEKALLINRDGGFKPLLKSLKTLHLDWPEQLVNPFFNINTQDDLKRAEQILCP